MKYIGAGRTFFLIQSPLVGMFIALWGTVTDFYVCRNGWINCWLELLALVLSILYQLIFHIVLLPRSLK